MPLTPDDAPLPATGSAMDEIGGAEDAPLLAGAGGAVPSIPHTTVYVLPVMFTVLSPWQTLSQYAAKCDRSRPDGVNKSWIGVNRFWNGVGYLTDIVWPVAYGAMFAVDLKHFQNASVDCYGTTLGQILIGLSPNYSTAHCALTSSVGSQKPDEFGFWAPMFIYAGAATIGVVNIFRSPWPYSSRHSAGSTNRLLYTAIHANNVVAVNALGDGDRRQRFSAIAALAEIVQQCGTENELGRTAFKHLCDAASYSELSSSRPKALATYLYANYKLFVLGRVLKTPPKRLYAALFTLTILPLNIFAKINLWRLFIQKWILAGEYWHGLRECDDSGLDWSFANEAATFACRACDWEFVSYARSLSPQGCLDGLLENARSPDTLLQGLSDLSRYGNFTHMDFSRQNFLSWTVLEWQALMDQLSSFSETAFAALNFSQAQAGPVPMDVDQLQALCDFLAEYTASFRSLDFSSINLGPDAAEQFIGVLNGTVLEFLSLRNTLLGDLGMEAMNSISPYSTFRQLDVSDNGITGYGIEQLMNATVALGVHELDISMNPIGATGIAALASRLYVSLLEAIDVSGIDFSRVHPAVLQEFAESICNTTTLQNLTLSGCNLADQTLAAISARFNDSAITAVDFSNNYIGANGVAAFVKQVAGREMVSVDFSQNFIDDLALNVLSQLQSAQWFIGNNIFSAAAFEQFIQTLPGSITSSVNLDHTVPADDAMMALFNMLAHNTTQVVAVSCVDCALSESTAVALFNALSQTAITTLYLPANAIAGALAALNAANTELETLDVTDNGIPADAMMAFINTTHGSALSVLQAGNNLFNDTVGLLLAHCMVGGVADVSRLGNAEPDLDFNLALSQGTPMTNLSYLDFSESGMMGDGIVALCQVALLTQFDIQHLLFSGLSHRVDTGVSGCPFNTTDVVVPSVLSMAAIDMPDSTLTVITSLLTYFVTALAGGQSASGIVKTLMSGLMIIYMLSEVGDMPVEVGLAAFAGMEFLKQLMEPVVTHQSSITHQGVFRQRREGASGSDVQIDMSRHQQQPSFHG